MSWYLDIQSIFLPFIPNLTLCAKVAGDRYSYLQIRYADIHADISADIYLHNFVHIGISADIPSICRYGSLSADIALYLQIWYVLQIYRMTAFSVQ